MWSLLGSNQPPTDYESVALTKWAKGPFDVRVGFEPTMSNHFTGLGTVPHYTPDKHDSSAFYSQHRGIVYNLARLTAVWELKFIVFFLS